MRTRRIAALLAFVAAAALAATLAMPTASAHTGTQQDEFFERNDTPQLKGPSSGWTRRTGSEGFGLSYWVTYGIGNSSTRDNWTVWDLGHRHGKQSLWVYVPHASDIQATVKYRVYRNGILYRKVNIDQGARKGWQKLGNFNFYGAEARIEVWDNETKEHYDRNNRNASRYAVDAVSSRCYSQCSITNYHPDNHRDLIRSYEARGRRIDKLENTYDLAKTCVREVSKIWADFIPDVVLDLERRGIATGLIGSILDLVPLDIGAIPSAVLDLYSILDDDVGDGTLLEILREVPWTWYNQVLKCFPE